MRSRVVGLGVLILDVLGRTCKDLSAENRTQLIDEIRLTAAGTVGGFAVDLAKLDVDVVAVGAIGEDDAGTYLLGLLERHGVRVDAVQRTGLAQTSASMLPINADGERSAFHVVGANAHLSIDDGSIRGLLEGAAHLHVGGPDAMGDFAHRDLGMVLGIARGLGVPTSLDLLGTSLVHVREPVRGALSSVDYFTPNEIQIRDLYRTEDLDVAADLALADGAGCVIISLGADGCMIASREFREQIPAFDVEVVDTTGCGDSFSAAFVRGKLLGWNDVEAARLGCAAGALVAGGLGSDAGIVDLASTIDAMTSLAVRMPG